MKLFTLSIALLLISLSDFAQTIACPGYFKRNNGNGACADGQLKLYFTVCPDIAPVIDSVFTNGVKATVKFALPDASKCNTQGYISYCVIGGNMPPAASWNIYFHPLSGGLDPALCIVSEGAVLPITIQSFSAKRNGANVALSWKTAMELNAQGFEIQRKSGNVFITIGTVSATNMITGSSYNFTDNNSSKETTEYRLRMLSKDAEAAYTQVMIVKGMNATADITIFPNPASGNSRISVTGVSETTDIQVIDNTGRMVTASALKAGNTFELSHLQKGIYRIRLINKNSGEVITRTLTITQ